jgi:Protein of unknown function (DUF3300)
MRKTLSVATALFVIGSIGPTILAQAPPSFSPAQLDQLTARIALYPDPLLAQTLAAATYPNDIPAAAAWADQHHYLTGQALADAITSDQLPWNPSVQALLPFPSVLDMMNVDMNWTTQLGNAFLAQQQEVMDAVQRQRALATRYGYLRTNGEVVVGGGPYLTIMIPVYDPAIVFVAPAPGFFVGGAVRFGFGVSIGGFFAPWGWVGGGIHFDWGAHAVFINNTPWGRTWVNRAAYVHPYPAIHRHGLGVARRADEHALEHRSEEERKAAHEGRPVSRELHKERGR